MSHSRDGNSEPVVTPPTRGRAIWTTFKYAFFVMIIGGGAGIWLPAVMPGKSVGIDALTTFVMAVLAPVFADLLLDDTCYQKLSKDARMSFAGACILGGAFALIGLVREQISWGWESAWVAVVISLGTWITLSIVSGKFLSAPATKAAIGGEVATTNNLKGSGLA